MDSPDPDLMHLYGTDAYYLEKRGWMEQALRAAPLAFIGAAAVDSRRAEVQRQQAEYMNYMFRQMEHNRMAPVIAGFKGASAASENIKLAEAMGAALARTAYAQRMELWEKLAEEELTELEKDALVGQLIGKGLGLAGRALGGAGKMMNPVGSFRGGWMGSAGTAARKAGINLRQQGTKMVASANKAGVAPAAAEAAAGAADKPWLSWGTKAKIGLGVLGAGGLYAGSKALGTAKDYMMQPSTQSTWGGVGGPSPTVNQFGY